MPDLPEVPALVSYIAIGWAVGTSLGLPALGRMAVKATREASRYRRFFEEAKSIYVIGKTRQSYDTPPSPPVFASITWVNLSTHSEPERYVYAPPLWTIPPVWVRTSEHGIVSRREDTFERFSMLTMAEHDTFTFHVTYRYRDGFDMIREIADDTSLLGAGEIFRALPPILRADFEWIIDQPIMAPARNPDPEPYAREAPSPPSPPPAPRPRSVTGPSPARTVRLD